MNHRLRLRPARLVLSRILELESSQVLKARLDRIQVQRDSRARPEGPHRLVRDLTVCSLAKPVMMQSGETEAQIGKVF